jgi:hypothetical protein
MARIEDVKDPDFRAALEEVDNLLGEGDYTAAAKRAADVYVALMTKHPQMIPQPPPVMSPQTTPGLPGAARGAGGQQGGAGFGANRFGWPNQGALRVLFDPSGKATISYEKERFSFSEAATYFEFIMTEAIRAEKA